MAKDKTTESLDEIQPTKVDELNQDEILPDTLDVVVLKGKHVKHDGEDFKQNTRLSLPADAAEHLIKIGFVKPLEDLQLEAQQSIAAEGASIEVDNGTSVTNPLGAAGGVE